MKFLNGDISWNTDFEWKRLQKRLLDSKRKKHSKVEFYFDRTVAIFVGGFVYGIILVAIPDQMISQRTKVWAFFAYFPLALVAWNALVIRDGVFYIGGSLHTGIPIHRKTNPLMFWSVVILVYIIALGIIVFVGYNILKIIV